MKKLLIGLLALGSLSSFAIETPNRTFSCNLGDNSKATIYIEYTRDGADIEMNLDPEGLGSQGTVRGMLVGEIIGNVTRSVLAFKVVNNENLSINIELKVQRTAMSDQERLFNTENLIVSADLELLNGAVVSKLENCSEILDK